MSFDSLVSMLHEAGYGGRLKYDEPLAAHTSFAIGGPADLLLVAHEVDELVEAAALAQRAGVAWRVLGAGTNVLVADRGIRGLVIVNACTRFSVSEEGLLTADSGALLSDVARAVSAQGWAGLAWAAGIPGTVGGAVVNNAGAYGGAMADVVVSATVRTAEGEVAEWSADRLDYGYRTSGLKSSPDCGRSCIVLRATLALKRGDAEELVAQVRQTEEQRGVRVPQGCCAGSVFKRTLHYPAGFLIEQAGLKGRRIGGAEVSPQHANFIMNVGSATAADVRALIEEVQDAVRQAFDVELEPEIQYIGEWD